MGWAAGSGSRIQVSQKCGGCRDEGACQGKNRLEWSVVWDVKLEVWDVGFGV